MFRDVTASSCPVYDFGSTATTTLALMFYGCQNIKRIVLINTENVLSLDRITHSTNWYLESISMDCTSATTTTESFQDLPSLKQIRLPGISSTFSVLNGLLGVEALVDLFNDLASGVTSQTVTITGNPGADDLTSTQLEIATDKGWTVTN